MIFDVRALAKQKFSQTRHAETEWLSALESARLSLKVLDVDYQALEQIALASRSPAKFTVMTRLIYHYTKSHPNGEPISDLILRSVNDSLFALADWIDAIDFFYQWLNVRKRKIDFLPMLKYLECCAASPDAKKSGQTISALVEDMLEVFDYLGN